MTTISGAGAHASAASTDRLPASKAGNKGYLTLNQIAQHYGPKETATELRAIDAAASVGDGTKVWVLGLAAMDDCPPFLVVWDYDSTATHDGRTVFRPTVGAASTGDGRWLRVINSNDHVDVRDFGAKCDAVTFFGVTVTAGSATVTGAGFSAALVGKSFVIPRGGATYNSISRGLTGTISAVASSTSLTLSLNAVTSVANTSAFSELIVGTDDSAAINAALEFAHKNKIKEVRLHGHAIIASTLKWEALSNVALVGRFSKMAYSPWHYNDGNYLTGAGANNREAANAASRIIWGGAADTPMALFRLGRRNATTGALDASGVWASSSGAGIRGILLDAAGVTCTGVALRGATACLYENVTVFRTPRASNTTYALDGDGLQNYDGSWDLGVALNSTFYNSGARPVDSAGHVFRNCWAIQRGTGIGGQRGWWIHGDRTWGNFCESDFFGGGAITDDSGAGMVQIEAEQSDSVNFYGFSWNGEFVLHARNTGARSSDAGSINTSTGAQCRSFAFYGYCGLLRVKGYTGSLPGGVTRREDVSANNHYYGGAPMENIDKFPIIEPGGQISVHTQGVPGGGGLGGVVFGGRPAMTAVTLTADEAIANSSLTTIAWDVAIGDGVSTPLLFKGPMGSTGAHDDTWKSGTNPSRVTAPNGVQWARVNVSLMWEANATGFRVAWLLQNGTRVARSGCAAIATEPTVTQLTLMVRVSAGDYFEVQGYQNSGGSLNVLSADNQSRIEVEFF